MQPFLPFPALPGARALGPALALAWALGTAQVTPAAPAPSLRLDQAAYDLGSGVLRFAFTLENPSDSAVYLDCQLPPRATLEGGTLVLAFGRGGSGGTLAGGPAPTDSAPAAVVDPDAYPPQRIAGRQTYQGQRRLDRVLGDPAARPRFASLKLVMDAYPERSEGEGPLYDPARPMRLSAPPRAVARQGKPPIPPKPVRVRRPAP